MSRRTPEEEEVENEEATEVEVEGARGGFRAGIGERRERGPPRCYIVRSCAAVCALVRS